MKKLIFLLTCTCIPALILFNGCLEEHVHTTIAPDGSSERTISMKLQSQTLPDDAFPRPADSTWIIEWKEIAEKDAKYEFIARKRFAGAEELQREYANIPDTNILGLRINITKRFEWFFSYLEYTETYTYRNPLGNVPVTDYLSKDEISRFVAGEKSDSLKRKVERWTSRDMMEELYRPLIKEAKRLNNSSLPASLLEEKKEEIFTLVMQIDSVNSKRKDSTRVPVAPVQDNVDSAEAVIKLIAKFLRTDAVYALRPALQQAWSVLESKLEKMKHPDGWVSSVQMPGIILETNSSNVEGNTSTWKFDPQQIQVGDVTMHAVSRVTNVWAFIITGLVVLAALVRILWPRKR